MRLASCGRLCEVGERLVPTRPRVIVEPCRWRRCWRRRPRHDARRRRCSQPYARVMNPCRSANALTCAPQSQASLALKLTNTRSPEVRLGIRSPSRNLRSAKHRRFRLVDEYDCLVDSSPDRQRTKRPRNWSSVGQPVAMAPATSDSWPPVNSVGVNSRSRPRHSSMRSVEVSGELTTVSRWSLEVERHRDHVVTRMHRRPATQVMEELV